MQFQIGNGDLITPESDCLIVGFYEQNELTPSAKKLDKLSKGYISNLLKQGDFEGKPGQTHWLFQVPHVSTPRILLVGCGEKETATSIFNYQKIINQCMKALASSKAKNATVFLCELNVEKRPLPWKIKQFVKAGLDALYKFEEFKSEKEPAYTLKTITLPLDGKISASAEEALQQGLAIASGVSYTKNLANLPGNICTPSYLAKEAKDLAKQYPSIQTKILEEKDMEKLGMGAFLAVARGSMEDAKLICLEYMGTSKKMAPIVFVGKGITFDTGGVSLKPSDGMVGMKYDMCGAATVLGVIKTVAELKLPLHVVGLLAAAENMPSGNSCKPEDIVTTLSGQTVEILNTDAEGRLVLCDALTYAERYKPDTVIDIATLTGAAVIALGHHATGLVANHQPLAHELLEAGLEAHDRAWQLPLWEEYQEQLKSPFADMANVGGRASGAITAGCFLSRFTKKYHWAHLDVAGTAAMMFGSDRYATGRPVPLLMQFLMNRVKS